LVRERLVAAGGTNLGDDFEESLSRLIRELPPPQVVFASADLDKAIIAARQNSEVDTKFRYPVEQVSEEDYCKWLAYLGITSVAF
jgi:hypothetical protein